MRRIIHNYIFIYIYLKEFNKNKKIYRDKSIILNIKNKIYQYVGILLSILERLLIPPSKFIVLKSNFYRNFVAYKLLTP